MELIITMSIICIGILLVMEGTRVPRIGPNGIRGEAWYYPRFLIVLFACVLIFGSGFREGFQDTGVYKILYTRIGTDFQNASNEDFVIQDYGFKLFMILLNRISPDPQALVIVSSFFTVTVYVHFIAKHASDVPFSLFLMLCVAFISTMNGIRQIMAGAIVVLGWPLLLKRRLIPFTLLVLLASSFHASAIIILPLSLIICGKRYNAGIWIFVLFVFFSFAFPSSVYRVMGSILEDSVYEDYLDEESKMGVMRLIVELVPVLISLLYHKLVPPAPSAHTGNNAHAEHQRVIDMLINMQIISFGFTALGLQMVYFARLSMYFALVLPVLLPDTIKGVFVHKSALDVKRISIALYLFYFAYQIYTYERIAGWRGMELIF